MLRPSRKTLFAIEAVLDIAYNAGDEPVQSRDITARQGIPRRYLEQVLQQLVRADILSGVRGPRGGYRLARERRRISIGDIVRLVDPPAAEAAEAGGSPLGVRVVQPLWRGLEAEFMTRLDQITIQDLCGEARSQGLQAQGERRLDYSI
ncbi:MAG: RrF2 family transcriptional regulator [Alphaproteobacteria bacterium]